MAFLCHFFDFFPYLWYINRMKKFMCIENLFFVVLCCAIIFEVYDTFSAESKVTLYSNAVSPNVVLSGAKDVTIPTEEELVGHLSNKDRFKYYLTNTNLIAHAGGGIDKKTYSNSKESLELAYENGLRIFEVDIYMTKDKKYVLTHDSNASNITYKEFMSSKIYNMYTPMDLNGLISFMKDHPYAYIIPDIKQYNNKEMLLDIYTKLFKYAGNDKNITDRIIGTFKRVDVFEFVESKMKFDIKMLYYRNTANQEKIINTYEKFLKYCLENNVDNVVFSYLQYNVYLSSIINNKNINVILYTLDNEALIEQYLYRGASAIMTNFRTPKKTVN